MAQKNKYRIVYTANHGNPHSDDTEGHISHSLTQLGHEVVKLGQNEPVLDGDILLFHKHPNLSSVANFGGIKVCWYFDKIKFHDREDYIRRVLEIADFVFVTDGTWAKENPHPKLRVLRQGIGDRDTSLGKRRYPDLYSDLAFTGTLYGERRQWFNDLAENYDIRAYNNIFNRDLYDLCRSTDIMVAPPTPGDDYYWSNRVYLTLGSGGFLLHPDYKGLHEEYEDGKHLVFYKDFADLVDKIDYYKINSQERKKIQRAGYKKTIQDYNFTKRVETLLNHVQTTKV